MFDKLIDATIKNRLLVLLVLIAAVISGLLVLPKLNLDAFPDVTNVQVQVNTEAPGLASKEVEQLITYPIEAVMYSLPDVEDVRSISKTGLSVITVSFKEGTNIYFARSQVFQQLQKAKEEIPSGIEQPEIGPNTSGLGQIYQYILESNNPEEYNAMALRSLNDWVVKPMLMPVPGVTDVLSFGGDVKQYQVLVNPYKLLSYKLTSADLIKAIESNNRNVGGWFLDRGNEQYTVRGVGWLQSGKLGLTELGNIPIKEEAGRIVRVKDVACLQFGSEIRQGAVTMMARNQQGQVQSLGEVVTGIVLKRVGANTKTTIEGIDARLPEINKALPKGVKLVPVYDQASLVNAAVNTVIKALLQAFLLILVILFIFLLDLRSTILVLISIPLSILFALMMMAEWGISANLMSLGGLAIAIGMLVDGSVVIMENIVKRLGEANESANIKTLIQQASKEVAKPVFFAVIIIVVVFAPLFSLEGVEGKLFHPMAQSIIFAMLGSLLVALLVIPALASYFFKKGIRQRESIIFKPIEAGYKKILKGILQHPKKIVTVIVTLFILTLFAMPYLGTEFVPQLEEGTLNVRVTLAPSVNLETSLAVSKKLEQQLMTFPEVTYVSGRVGRPELGGDPEPVSNIELLVGLKPIAEWSTANNRQALEQQMEKRLSKFPGLLFSFSQPIATRVDELLSGVKAQLAVKLFGPNLKVLSEKGKVIEGLVKQVKGTADVSMEQITGEPQLVIEPKREALMRYGISVNQIMSLVSDEIGGKSAGQIINGNERYDIYVRLQKQYRDNINAIKDLEVLSPNGAWVRLGDVATVKIESGPPQIRRDDVQRRVVIEANVVGRDMGSVVADIKSMITQKADLPAGYTVQYGGQFKNQERAQARLMIVVPIALGLIFILLYFAFASVGKALLMMVNVPLALIGGVFALLFSGQYLSLPGSIGFIALSGIAVLNGVVLVNAISNNIANGMSSREAVFEGALSRLRPVLLTALTSMFGLIPMLLAQGVGAEIQRPLATVVVGGMLTSTPLTLLVLPVLYLWIFCRDKN